MADSNVTVLVTTGHLDTVEKRIKREIDKVAASGGSSTTDISDEDKTALTQLKEELGGYKIASDAQVTTMINNIFGTP